MCSHLLIFLPRQLEELDALKRCVGWELESAAEDPVSGEAALRLAGLFRLRLSISRAGAAAAVEVLPGGHAQHSLAAACFLVGVGGGEPVCSMSVHVGCCGSLAVKWKWLTAD